MLDVPQMRRPSSVVRGQLQELADNDGQLTTDH